MEYREWPSMDEILCLVESYWNLSLGQDKSRLPNQDRLEDAGYYLAVD